MKCMGLSALSVLKLQNNVGFMKVGTKYSYSWQSNSVELIVMLTNSL